jgi:hypothetical protein
VRALPGSGGTGSVIALARTLGLADVMPVSSAAAAAWARRVLNMACLVSARCSG